MAKKQTRRSISVSRVTYERLKAFCETNSVSMSQFVETRVGDFLGEGSEPMVSAAPAARLTPPPPIRPLPRPVQSRPAPAPISASPASPLTSLAAAARAALEPRVVIASVERTADPKPPTKRTADQIFTF